MRRLRAGALSALCPLLAVLVAATPGRAAEPCPTPVDARSDSRETDPKAAELALETVRARCAAAVAAVQSESPPPSFNSEVEPNDVPATPTNISLLNGIGILAGEINGPGDVDFFRFFAPSAGRIWILTDTGGVQQPGANSRDTTIDLYGVDGATLIESDDDDGTAT